MLYCTGKYRLIQSQQKFFQFYSIFDCFINFLGVFYSSILFVLLYTLSHLFLLASAFIIHALLPQMSKSAFQFRGRHDQFCGLVTVQAPDSCWIYFERSQPIFIWLTGSLLPSIYRHRLDEGKKRKSLFLEASVLSFSHSSLIYCFTL